MKKAIELISVSMLSLGIIISQGYGIQKDGSFHHGIDIAVPAGQLIITKLPGIVVKAGNYGVYGLTVIIDHGNGLQTLYAHNSKILVQEGDIVTPGKGIALTGDTGKSTGNHIHFEIRQNGKAINPNTIK